MKQLLDDTPLTFGKYEGETPNEIAIKDPLYIVWMFDTLNKRFCTRKLREACEDAGYDNEEERELDHFYGMDGW